MPTSPASSLAVSSTVCCRAAVTRVLHTQHARPARYRSKLVTEIESRDEIAVDCYQLEPLELIAIDANLAR